ncbi:MAG: DUF3078 domain-containing protein [Rikenellaceae bacterium]|nr:DUF3078 domain-containing protein [Rikenellaceae bacterium]
MKLLRILWFTGFIMFAGGASAQFTISTVTPGEITARDLRDSLAPDPMVVPATFKNDFFDRAFWLAEKRRIRRSRHHTELNAALQVSQTQFKNWAAGGDNTFNGLATLYFRHSHKREKLSYDASFDGRYGMNFIDNTRFKNIDEFKIILNSSWDINQWWSYAASATLRSQFSTGYKSRDEQERVSTIMAPGFLELSVGFKYTNKPFSVLISPVGGNAVFVLDRKLREVGMNGVDPGDKAKWEVGPSLRFNLDYEFYKKIFWIRSELYTFTNLKKTPMARWETNLDIRATKFLTTTFKGILYYDRQSEAEKPKSLQYNSVISVGLSYSFRSKQ